MGANQAKKSLQKAVETDNVEMTRKILQQFPQMMEEPLYSASNITPLARASWRGCIDMVMLLCEAGANPNQTDNDGVTPLMWGAKRDNAGICVTLLRFNANPTRRSREGLSALDYAILHGNYESAYIIYEFNKLIQEALSYETIRQLKMWRWVDYEYMIQQLCESVPPQKVGDFLTKPPGKTYQDPVIDPRESWKDMIKRIMKFEPPPLCERSELPEHLQPQNRLLGRLNSYINGMSIEQIDSSQELNQIVVETNDEKHNDEKHN